MAPTRVLLQHYSIHSVFGLPEVFTVAHVKCSNFPELAVVHSCRVMRHQQQRLASLQHAAGELIRF